MEKKWNRKKVMQSGGKKNNQKQVTGQSHFKLQQNAGEIRENEKSKNLPNGSNEAAQANKAFSRRQTHRSRLVPCGSG